MNNKEIATAIVKALESKDSVELYGIALQLLKSNDAMESLKLAQIKATEELNTYEENARNSEEDYSQTVNRLNAEGYLDGLNFAIALLTKENN